MAYRKLGRDNKHRRSMLSSLTKQLILNESIQTTETRAKEVRSIVDELITLGKRGDLHARRQAAAYLFNVKDEELLSVFRNMDIDCSTFDKYQLEELKSNKLNFKEKRIKYF